MTGSCSPRIVTARPGFSPNCLRRNGPDNDPGSSGAAKYSPWSISHPLKRFISSGTMPLTATGLLLMAVFSVRNGTAVNPLMARIFATSAAVMVVGSLLAGQDGHLLIGARSLGRHHQVRPERSGLPVDLALQAAAQGKEGDEGGDADGDAQQREDEASPACG